MAITNTKFNVIVDQERTIYFMFALFMNIPGDDGIGGIFCI
jgi:hypothetical protein